MAFSLGSGLPLFILLNSQTDTCHDFGSDPSINQEGFPLSTLGSYCKKPKIQPCITVTGTSMGRDYKANHPVQFFGEFYFLLPQNPWGEIVTSLSWKACQGFWQDQDSADRPGDILTHGCNILHASFVCISDTTKNVPSILLTFLHFKGSSGIFHFLPAEEYGLLSNNTILVAHPSNFQ